MSEFVVYLPVTQHCPYFVYFRVILYLHPSSLLFDCFYLVFVEILHFQNSVEIFDWHIFDVSLSKLQMDRTNQQILSSSPVFLLSIIVVLCLHHVVRLHFVLVSSDSSSSSALFID